MRFIAEIIVISCCFFAFSETIVFDNKLKLGDVLGNLLYLRHLKN